MPAVLFRHGASDDVSEEFLEDVTPVAGPTADAAAVDLSVTLAAGPEQAHP